VTDYTQLIREHRYSRRGFIAATGGTLSVSALLAACGGSTSSGGDSSAGTAAGGTASGTLLFYNWVAYVNPDTYKSFTADTGVDVKKDFYESNEELQAKLQAGARGFDLAVPTGYMVQILADAGLLQELDHAQMPNVDKNIDPKFTGLPYDPDDKFSIPKDWGTTGFMYRSDMVKENPTSWREFFDLAKGPYSGKVMVLDGIPEVVGSTAVMLGYSYNTDNPDELDQVKNELIDLKPHIQAITSTNYKQSMIDGKTAMALGWNGDGAAVAAEVPAEYVIADEGGEFWVDAYVIPVGAKNTAAAYAWIDYVYDPAHNSTETEYTYYGSPVKRDLLDGVIDPKVLADEDVFPPAAVLDKLEPNTVTAEGTKLRDRIWTEFKAA
jgi:spermidine/putrescine transport system substrate-binding protein